MLSELERIQTEICQTSTNDFARLSELLQRRGEILGELKPTPEARELLIRVAEHSRQLQIRIQAERRRLCLDAGDLKNRQRILDAML